MFQFKRYPNATVPKAKLKHFGRQKIMMEVYLPSVFIQLPIHTSLEVQKTISMPNLSTEYSNHEIVDFFLKSVKLAGAILFRMCASVGKTNLKSVKLASLNPLIALQSF